MMVQYQEIKSQYPDTLLMFRLGDFYELFLDDAKVASEVLEITLTGRDAGEQGRVPMCGVPYHSVEQYLNRLIDKGYSVAICEQTEDPRQAKGLVRREVVRVVTPGTALPDTGADNRYLACLAQYAETFGLCFADVGTGEVYTEEFDVLAECVQELVSWQPVELLIYDDTWDKLQGTGLRQWEEEIHPALTRRTRGRASREEAIATVLSQYSIPDLTPLDLQESLAAAEALGTVLRYVAETQQLSLNHFRHPSRIRQRQTMQLDKNVLTQLEVLESVRTRRQTKSLYGLLHRTKTAMGSRLLKRWLERPLLNIPDIVRRQEAVEAFVDNFFLRNHVQTALGEVYDLERLLGRVCFASANARDLQAIARSLLQVPEVMGMLAGESVPLFTALLEGLPDVSALAEEIERTLAEELPASVKDGGIIREGVDAALDELRHLSQSGKTWLAELESRERAATGIKNLKVGYNKVFGYYIEVSKGNVPLVPSHYERRQTLAQAERYVLPELKEYEAKILNAEENATQREYELFVQLREGVRRRLADLQQIADTLAQIDVLCAFATVSVEGRYVRPTMDEKRGIAITAGRHPVVEAQMKGRFVPNDILLDKDRQLLLITGPNMAGKSTFMRQTALIVLLAHIGCFVPAASAKVGVVDRIFTRIGASDDLTAGQSTFMVEMVELAQVLLQATERSLVLLDEIGRGTSTYDGLSIAEAVLERLSEPNAPLTLFATHYHELTETAKTMAGVVNASVLVQEEGDNIAFLHTVVNRPANQSYGIQVARLAGVPQGIIQRAQELLQIREDSGTGVFRHQGSLGLVEAAPALDEGKPALDEGHPALYEGHPAASAQDADILELLNKMAALNVMNMTPIEALNELYHLAERAKGVMDWDKFK